jgi:hypothetical protein
MGIKVFPKEQGRVKNHCAEIKIRAARKIMDFIDGVPEDNQKEPIGPIKDCFDKWQE